MFFLHPNTILQKHVLEFCTMKCMRASAIGKCTTSYISYHICFSFTKHQKLYFHCIEVDVRGQLDYGTYTNNHFSTAQWMQDKAVIMQNPLCMLNTHATSVLPFSRVSLVVTKLHVYYQLGGAG